MLLVENMLELSVIIPFLNEQEEVENTIKSVG
jgi:glycosyltransferase involved in cell wall biosynthesis